MRLWHKDIIHCLPDMQLKGQWRECCLIAKDIKEKGGPNHLLVNILKCFLPREFKTYCFLVYAEMVRRGFKPTESSVKKLKNWMEIFCLAIIFLMVGTIEDI